MNGRIIDPAKWEVSSIADLREGQSMQISLPTADTHLVNYVGKASNAECSVDRTGGSYSVIVNCVVKRIRHMLDTANGGLESMAVLVPMNRMAESIIMYVTDVENCDIRFRKLVQT